MKKVFKSLLVASCAAVCVFGASACGAGRADLLASPKEATSLEYSQRNSQTVKALSRSAEAFAAEFASLAYQDYDKDVNFAVAPVSVYMALSLAAQCAYGDTRAEILSALDVSYSQLADGFSDYYRSLFAEFNSSGKTEGLISFSNSIWIDKHASVNDDCIGTLADKFFCHSYKTDFVNDNATANAAVRKFVKDKTNGLIDKDFRLGKLTEFALINTLYLKDIWNCYGDDLPFTDCSYSFENGDSTATDIKLLQGYYNAGRVYEGVNYKTFFTATKNGNKIKFILPNDGYSVKDVFTEESISEVNSVTDFNAIDGVNKIRYSTRCLFPEFSASYDADVKEHLKEMGIRDLFGKRCDFTSLTSDDVYCEAVKHVTKLKVDKTGVEGAAVTVVDVDGTAQPNFDNVYLDFVIDRSFGFILTDRYDNTLFSGVVNRAG